MNTRPDARAAWATAALGAALTLVVFWPGLMSADSAWQYAQALDLRPLDDSVPPLMTLAWRLLDRLVPGPGAMFALLAAAWWGGIAAVVSFLPLRRVAMIALVLGIGLFPPTFVVLGHVWKDVAMAAALLWAAAAILAHARARRARWRMLALLALAVACAMRHNAILAVLPLLAWLCWPASVAPAHAGNQVRGTTRGERTRSAMTFLLLASVLAAAPGAFTHAVRARPTQAWTVVALWDLAALSIATERVLIPPGTTYLPVTVDELRSVYVPYANPPLFGLGKFYVSLYVPYAPPKAHELQRAWLAAVAEHPVDYLRHRARLARYLLLGIPHELPRELVYVPARIVPPGVAYAPPAVDADAPGFRLIEWLRPTPLFGGALYLALAAAALLAARGNNAHRPVVTALAASSWANALPLLVISGSAEFRYLAWSVLAALLACAFALVGRRARIG